MSAIPFHVCPYCGSIPIHSPAECPAVLEVEYFENGMLKRIVKRDAWFPVSKAEPKP
jgi:hypothetical protein